jgi:hypothetical protein
LKAAGVVVAAGAAEEANEAVNAAWWYTVTARVKGKREKKDIMRSRRGTCADAGIAAVLG